MCDMSSAFVLQSLIKWKKQIISHNPLHSHRTTKVGKTKRAPLEPFTSDITSRDMVAGISFIILGFIDHSKLLVVGKL